MNFKNKEVFLNIKFQKSDTFKNPFIYYYPGCSKELIDNINDICPICYKIIKKSKVFPDSCQHAFCLHCLSTWKESNSTCPICRKYFRLIK